MKKDPLILYRQKKQIAESERMLMVGDLSGALTGFDGVLGSDPSNGDALHGKGIVLMMQGRFPEALSLLVQSTEQSPEEEGFWNDLGEAYRANGHLEKAIECYERASTLNPNYAVAINNMGVALLGMGRLDDARHCFESSVSVNPDYPEPYNNLGMLYEAQCDYPMALESYETAVKLDKNFSEALENYAALLRSNPGLIADTVYRLIGNGNGSTD